MPQPTQLLNPIALNIQSDCPGVSGRKNKIIIAANHTTNSKFDKNKDQYFLNILFNIIYFFLKTEILIITRFACKNRIQYN